MAEEPNPSEVPALIERLYSLAGVPAARRSDEIVDDVLRRAARALETELASSRASAPEVKASKSEGVSEWIETSALLPSIVKEYIKKLEAAQTGTVSEPIGFREIAQDLIDARAKNGSTVSYRNDLWDRLSDVLTTPPAPVVTHSFQLKWLAGARPPVHPSPMQGSQSFDTFENALQFFNRQASDAQFVSLTEHITAVLTVSHTAKFEAALASREVGNHG